MEQVLVYMLYQFLGFSLNTHISLWERFLSVENRSSLLVFRDDLVQIEKVKQWVATCFTLIRKGIIPNEVDAGL